MSAEDIARALGRGSERREGAGWRCWCPVHESTGEHKSPSLSVQDKGDGKVVWCCRSAGCSQDAITAALRARGLLDGQGWREEDRNGKGIWGAITRYDIRDADGQTVAVHCRLDKPDGKVVWWERDGKKGLGGLNVASLPLYQTDTLRALADGATVVVTEGEKACDALSRAGFAAVGTITGAGGLHDDASLRTLVRLRIVLWPDHDEVGRAHMGRHGDRLKALGVREIAVVDWPDAPEHGDAADFEGDDTALLTLINAARPFEIAEEHAAEAEPELEPERLWPFIPAREFLAQGDGDDKTEYIIENMLAPGAVTFMVSARGVGKTHVAHAMIVSMAIEGLFAGRPTKLVRVALIDRDNPAREIRRRLRRWGALLDADDKLQIITRGKAKPLTDAKAWKAFPVEDFGVVVLDSWGAASEGVDEKEAGESGQAIAPLLDIARRGPAVLVLANTDKLALKIRGSGVISDRADFVYEIRDMTDATLDPKKETWHECLPPAGEESWLDKSRRRKKRDCYRLAFFASKFRVGDEPEPFVLEVRVPDEGEWDVVDVTTEVEREHDEAKGLREEGIVQGRESAVEKLRQKIAEGAEMSKTQGEEFLRSCGLKRKEARDALEVALQSIFTIEKDDNARGRGAKKGILKIRMAETTL